MKRENIQIRDPFILPVKEENKYYLYGTTDKNCWGNEATGFDGYCSSDLEEWEGPFAVFRPEENFWADKNFWAPEVYQYDNSFYMFASFKKDGIHRGTQILKADNPKGPFRSISSMPITPNEWECLDGTLYVDGDLMPWIVFSREWVQVADGEIWTMPLSKDLTKAIGEPVLLFKASQAIWTKGGKHPFAENEQGEIVKLPNDGNLNKIVGDLRVLYKNSPILCDDNDEFLSKIRTVEKSVYVTDGPYIYKTEKGELLMLWSSRGEEGYAMGIARSESGDIKGPWKHQKTPLYGKDGGHGMIFRTFEGKLMFTIHSPNKTPNERPVFIEIDEVDGRIVRV